MQREMIFSSHTYFFKQVNNVRCKDRSLVQLLTKDSGIWREMSKILGPPEQQLTFSLMAPESINALL